MCIDIYKYKYIYKKVIQSSQIPLISSWHRRVICCVSDSQCSISGLMLGLAWQGRNACMVLVVKHFIKQLVG